MVILRNGEKRDRVLNGEDMGKVRRTCQSDVRKERLRYVEHEVLEMWMLCVPQRAGNCGCVYKDSKLGLLLRNEVDTETVGNLPPMFPYNPSQRIYQHLHRVLMTARIPQISTSII